MLRHITASWMVLVIVGSALAEEVRGRIVAVDLDGKELLLEGRNRGRGVQYRFVLTADTHVLFAGEPGKLSDLPTRRLARITFEDGDGKAVARVIRLPLPLRAITGKAPPPTAAERPGGDVVTGTLQRIAVTDRELVVIGPGAKGNEAETTIAVPEGTPILRDGKKIDLVGLQEGEAVSVQVDRKEKQLKAVSVQAGKVVPQAGAMRNNDVVPRVRQALKVLDAILQQMERQRDR
jgi:hypothetical protein